MNLSRIFSLSHRFLFRPSFAYYSSDVPQDIYEKHSVETLESLTDKLEEILESQSGKYDVTYSNNVLTVSVPHLGTYVINKQGPNKQIWLSSPLSGPKRFDLILDSKSWVYTRSGESLHSILSKEITSIVPRADLSSCYFGGS
ncbi:FXN [Lepeophtheirus salmonis]|uniref:ferroxidase n=1 Tax=Lepeophtheirus salmonis TaxID=72036 RepID=A0A7R8HDX3_LEPSM|nr:frataxin, mitochondrial-like [Lepeophtheirus salmonis]CAB4069983.1 FXN [Lepeophtheirus salmonis]CAF3037713.1 FXN [Lepeophtheirus salmonis]